MSGKIDWFILISVGLVSGLAVVMDLSRGRIYNWLTFPTLIVGVCVSGVFAGWQGFVHALFGVLAGLLAYGWMYFFGFMGAGDVKLLMALGAWLGGAATLETALLSILLGGALSVLNLFLRGKLLDFCKRVYRAGLSLVVKELEPSLPVLDQKNTMPFALPIGLAAVLVLTVHPFQRWGVNLW